MKFGIRIDYSKYLVLSQKDMAKMTEVIANAEVRIRNDYGVNASYTPDKESIEIIVIREDQLIDQLIVEPKGEERES